MDVPSGVYDDIVDPNAVADSVTEDVELDPLVYDYVIPKAKDVDPLRVTAGPEQGGIQIVRIPPAKFMWDNLQEDAEYLEEMFPADLRNWGGPDVAPALPAEPQAEVIDDDVLDHPFLEDAGGGGAFGTMDDGLADPEYLLEIDIVATLMSFDFEADEWLDHNNTVWEHYPGFYISKKGNRRVNKPALDGRNGAPSPCMVSGERWTYAWASRPSVLNESEDDLRFPRKQYVISDSSHLPPNCKDQLTQDHLAFLRRTWYGVQFYLKSGVRFIQEAPSSGGRLLGVEHLIAQISK